MVLRRVVAVVSGKGGVGKTTVTANLGVALFSEFERSVLLIDSNLTSSHLGIHFGLIYFPFTINSILEGETRLMNAIYRHPSGVHLLPASFNVYEEPEITYRKFSYIIYIIILCGGSLVSVERKVNEVVKKIKSLEIQGAQEITIEGLKILKPSYR